MDARQAIKDFLNSCEDQPLWVDSDIDLLVADLDLAGFVICPKEPTEEMTQAGLNTQWDDPYPQAWVRKIYHAMLAALQKEKPQTYKLIGMARRSLQQDQGEKPASRQLLNITKRMLDHAETECEALRAKLAEIGDTPIDWNKTDHHYYAGIAGRFQLIAAPPSPESDTEDDGRLEKCDVCGANPYEECPRNHCEYCGKTVDDFAPAPQEHPKEPRHDGVIGCNCYPPHETTKEFDAAHPPQEQKQEAGELVKKWEQAKVLAYEAPMILVGNNLATCLQSLTEKLSKTEKLYNAAKRSRDDMALDVAHHAKQRAMAETKARGHAAEEEFLREKLAEAGQKIELLKNTDSFYLDEIAENKRLEQQVERLVKERDELRAALEKIANEDYRGNAPQSINIARAALTSSSTKGE